MNQQQSETTSTAGLDLSRLAMDRPPIETRPSSNSGPRRKWITRYLIPGFVLSGFVALAITTAGTQLLPRQSVEVMPVIVKRASAQPSGTALFQAAGWIEPRPTAIKIPALAPGVIDELFVVEGQAIKKGDPIARLIVIDAELQVSQAKSSLANSEGMLNRALAEQRAAKIRLDQPTHLQVQLADAQQSLAQVELQNSKLPFLIAGAQADLDYAKQSVKGKLEAGNAVSGVVLQKAKSELAIAKANVEELNSRKPGLQREIDALKNKVAALETQLKLLVEERRQLEEADAKVQSARASRDRKKLELQLAELFLERTTIRAPINGRILRLIALPGMRVMGLDSGAEQNSSTVVEMYDPKRLQVRADVRLADVPLVQQGQIVEIRTDASEKVIQGRVLQANSSANIQKNTLEVKVEVIDPPDSIRPEMLVATTFLSPKIGEQASDQSNADRLFIPTELLVNLDGEHWVWVVDYQQRARKRRINTGAGMAGHLVEVNDGLKITDKLITTDHRALKDGGRVNVIGEDQSIGK